MKITLTRQSTSANYTLSTEHSASSHGIPVLLDADNDLVDFSRLLDEQMESREMGLLHAGLMQAAYYDNHNEDARLMIDAAWDHHAYTPWAALEAARIEEESARDASDAKFIADNPDLFA